jgi:replicative DNA helicase
VIVLPSEPNWQYEAEDPSRLEEDPFRWEEKTGGAISTGFPKPLLVRERSPIPSALTRALTGGVFVFREPIEIPAVWGHENAVLWAAGEGLLIVGPDGVGKSTLAQQLALRRCGIGPRRTLLGEKIARDDRPVLYVAADRPRQVARSLRRMVRDDEREALDERLIVWPGPLPFDLTESPKMLADFALKLGVGTVFIDSLKDVALDLSKDETGSRVNLACQELVAADIELCAIHHQRKETSQGGKPKRLPDVYGSRWLTAGMGSVMLLWGESGDLVVEVAHLKQPAEEVGPLQVIHDHLRGVTSLYESVDLEQLLATAVDGLFVADAARALFNTGDRPSRNLIEKARRRLEGLIESGRAIRKDDPDGSARYFLREIGA